MLLCKQATLSGIWNAYIDPGSCRGKPAAAAHSRNGTKMSNTTSVHSPSATFFGRLMATIDRLLMTSARIAARNGDLPYFGL
jgi:hypothetical protein